MKRLLLAFALILVATAALAQDQPNNIAHGAEKTAAEATRPGGGESQSTGAPKFLGLPAWIWKLANMIAFLAFLAWALGGPIKRAIAERQERIQSEAAQARERRAKAEEMARDIQTRLAQIEEEVRQIRERAQSEGERQKREMIAAAEAEAQKILQSARSEVDNQLKNARHELTEYAGQLASERAEQLLREKITDADREKLFRESLNEMEEARS
ncbi:MAG TPA: ATP synthase F0 subunit B [Thermoanaerobaculia bacterium]|nr:ATP synthase F0 subunit B [Thermoanaerobaculia bacterium]